MKTELESNTKIEAKNMSLNEKKHSKGYFESRRSDSENEKYNFSRESSNYTNDLSELFNKQNIHNLKLMNDLRLDEIHDDYKSEPGYKYKLKPDYLRHEHHDPEYYWHRKNPKRYFSVSKSGEK